MKIIIVVFFTLFTSFNSFSANIRVIDLNYLIENHNDFLNLISKIEEDQKFHKSIFSNIEKDLEKEQKRINELKMILDSLELEKIIDKYNKDLNNFNLKINNFNIHYESQIINLKNQILEKILEILKKYSLDNEIELILDSNSYILSSNNINITSIIKDNLKEIKFDISFEKYK